MSSKPTTSDAGTPEGADSTKTSPQTGRCKSPAVPASADYDQMVPFYQGAGLDYAGTLPKGSLAEQQTATNALFEPDAHRFVVRAQDYAETKIKVRSTASLLRFVAADLVALPGTPKLCDACAHAGTLPVLYPDRRFVVLNWQLPASPPFSFVVYYVFPTAEELAQLDLTDDERAARTRAFALLEKFASPDTPDEWRNNRFKLIPQIVEGPWLVKKMTPSGVPALIGNKLTTTYHRGPNYMEIDVDITSSSTANGIWSVISRTLASLVIDLAFVIQGNEIEELPEVIFGAVRISRVTLSPDFVKKLE